MPYLALYLGGTSAAPPKLQIHVMWPAGLPAGPRRTISIPTSYIDFTAEVNLTAAMFYVVNASPIHLYNG